MSDPDSSASHMIDDLPGARRNLYRQQILAAAELEFARSGFDQAKVNAIAETAGVALGTLYKYFPSKAAIWDVLTSQRMDEFRSAVMTLIEPLESPFEKLLASARAEVMFLADHPNFLELHLTGGLSWGTAVRGEHARRHAWQSGMHLLGNLADEARCRGEIRDLRPSIVASMIISTLQIWMTEWVNSNRDRRADAVADEVVEHLRICLAAGG
ncbi:MULTISPECIES: TetR/AcrR family transcriptional regulator [Mycobacterium]|nr:MULTISPECIES: TetR/AcrR family transcriptional regulator [Mycobacterium]